MKTFFRFFGLRQKFRFIIHTDSQKKNKVMQNLSVCTIEKLSEYEIVRLEFQNKKSVSNLQLKSI